MPFLSNSLKALVTGTVTNGFPSVTSVLQHLVFKMSFHDVLFIAPSPSPGGDEKVILIFQRCPINYSTGLCIAYSLQLITAQHSKMLYWFDFTDEDGQEHNPWGWKGESKDAGVRKWKVRVRYT